MFSHAIFAFVTAFLAAGFRRPFLFVLAYTYIDIVAPQKIGWSLLSSMSISLIAFVLAFLGWMVADDKRDLSFGLRQWLLLALLVYCGLTTQMADFPLEAAGKWAWVWKALVFAMFLPLTLRTRLRIEALALVMVLSAGAIIIGGAIKTAASGGGYGSLRLFIDDNTGLYEGSIISTVAIALIPLVLWLARHGTIFPPDWRVKLFGWALVFACLLLPVGTQARTGLICVGVLGLLWLRTAKNRFVYLGLIGAAAMIALPLLPTSFTQRMETIENHAADESASTRLAVWRWTLDYVQDNPFGGGFQNYLQNDLHVELVETRKAGNNNVALSVQSVEQKARAYHSSYFEMLGEQGWPGLFLWLLLHGLGVWQMELLLRRYRRRTAEPQLGWVAPLAAALQQAQIVYLVGSLFVGIAFQPFCYMLVGLQCALWAYVRRHEQTAHRALPFVRPRPGALPAH